MAQHGVDLRSAVPCMAGGAGVALFFCVCVCMCAEGAVTKRQWPGCRAHRKLQMGGP